MKKIILRSFLVSLLFLLVAPAQILAIGQITEPIVINNGLRGQEVVATLTLLNSEKKENIIGLVAEGQIADWTSFYQKDDQTFTNPIKEIKVAAGQYLDVAALFKIPADTANGDYVGEISVVYNPEQTSSTTDSSSSVAQKISRAVKITVSDQENIQLDASVIPDKFDYQPSEPLNVRIIYDNQSNIVLNPSIQFKIKQNDQTLYNVIYPYPEGSPTVRSMSLYEIPAISIPTDSFGTGNFLAELNFLKGDQTILTKNFSFSIGSSQGKVLGSMTSIFKNNLLALVFGVVILVLVIVIIALVAKKSSHSKSDTGVN